MGKQPASPASLASAQKTREGWKKTQAGVVLVLLGLVGQFLFCLALTILLVVQEFGEFRQSSGSITSDLTLPLTLTGIWLASLLLLVVGRLRCLACPRDAASLLQASVGGTVGMLLSGAAGSYLAFRAGMGQEVHTKAVLGAVVASLIALGIAEGSFVRFLKRLSVFVEDDSLRRSVDGFIRVVVITAVLTVLASLVVYAVTPASQQAFNPAARAASVATIVERLLLVIAVAALVLYGWYGSVVFESWGAIQEYVKESKAPAPMAFEFPDSPSENCEDSMPPKEGNDEGFERYPLKEPERKGDAPTSFGPST
jgi:hypothetical protein